MTALAQTIPGEVRIRPFREADRDFIEGSWIDSYRDGFIDYLTAPPVDPMLYYQGQRRLVRALMNRRACTMAVAVTPDYDDAILGWAVSEYPATLHYIYVKTLFRDNGIARALLARLDMEPARLIYTHVTKRAKDILLAYPDARFNPWLLVEGS